MVRKNENYKKVRVVDLNQKQSTILGIIEGDSTILTYLKKP